MNRYVNTCKLQGVQCMTITQDHILRELQKNLQNIDTLVQFGAKSFKKSPKFAKSPNQNICSQTLSNSLDFRYLTINSPICSG